MVKMAAIVGILIGSAVIGLLVFEYRVGDVPPGQGLGGQLSAPQAKAVDLLVDLSKTLIAWALVVAGGAAFFLKLNVDKGLTLRRVDVVLTFVTIILSILSLYFGQVTIDLVIRGLAVDQFPLHHSNVTLSLRFQYLSVLAAVSLFGVHVFQFFWLRATARHGA